MVPVNEMEPAVAFYQSVFGLEPVNESGEWTEIPGGRSRGRPPSCRGRGGRIVEPLGSRIAIVADPDGNEISIMPAR